MKKKGTTALLALIFGVFGLHRFYLGEKFKGFVMLFIFFVTFSITVDAGEPLIIFPAILALIDAVLFKVKPQEEFDEKYNSKYLDRREEEKNFIRRKRRRQKESRIEVEPINTFKESGMRKYDDYDILGAITDFRKALNSNFKDNQVHYLIACCYSINEEPEKSLFHLDKSVDFGFVDFDTIHNVDALAFLRTHKRFEEFVNNSYQIPRYLPAEEDAKLDLMEDANANDLLNQVAALGELYEKGVLTPDEFQKQKQKLFNP